MISDFQIPLLPQAFYYKDLFMGSSWEKMKKIQKQDNIHNEDL